MGILRMSLRVISHTHKRSNLVFFLVFLLFQLLIAQESPKVYINTASRDEVRTLPLNETLADSLYNLRIKKGYFKSIYEILDTPGMDSDIFEKIKHIIVIEVPEERREVSKYILYLQERLAAEESPREGAIDEWEDLLLSPININRASVDDILLLDRVTPVDAVSAVKHRRFIGRLRYVNALKNAKFLSSYGFRNMRNYIVTTEPEVQAIPFSMHYRIRYDHEDMWIGDEDSYSQRVDALNSQIQDLVADTTSNLHSTLLDAGWSLEEIDGLRSKLFQEKEALISAKPPGVVSNRLRLRWKKYAKLGGIIVSRHGEEQELSKGYVTVMNQGPLEKFIVGNYRVTIGQGLLFDNTDEERARLTRRVEGLFGDLTDTEEFKLSGVAGKGNIFMVHPLFFYSKDRKDGILNRDGTVNSYFYTQPRASSSSDVFSQEDYGGALKVDLSDVLFIPLGTYISFNGYQTFMSKPLRPDTSEIDIPFDKDKLDDLNYLMMQEGRKRTYLGTSFRTVYKNLSFEGEYVRQKDYGYGYILKSLIQFNTFYVIYMKRHYSVDFFNPYSRAFSEQSKFDDTIVEKDYRLIDPLYTDLQDLPIPKAEDGHYFETRYQILRNLTITRAYIDVWRNLAYNLSNVRIQGEIEYKPVFPLRFRIKQKWQVKQLPKAVFATTSRTQETTLRVFATVAGDYLSLEARYGRVKLTPNEKYSGNLLMEGGYLDASWEHNFSDFFSVVGGVAIWDASSMSQWIFEDTGIDFLYGEGKKYYITFKDRLSENISIRFKVRNKSSSYPHTGIYGSGNEYHYGDSEETLIRDFTDVREQMSYNLQIDVRW
ncbi:helix-hairpin-helix domain-containing protein [candidate division WOR-3 bacterium]|nr:helix-hairpin-helix domain-containing protein [candidate division WOR-3 bacterium]